VHEDNEWCITLVDEDSQDPDAAGGAPDLVAGVSHAYSRPQTTQEEETIDTGTSEQSLEDLMAQMKQM